MCIRDRVKDDISDALIIKIRNAYWFGFAIYLAAFIISFFLPYVGLLICVSLWIFWTLLDYDRKKKSGRNVN
jgi:Ca2+-dependent lipid-binding protein